MLKAIVAFGLVVSVVCFAVPANAADQLFVNVGPIPRGVTAGNPQTVFQFVHATSPSGPTVPGVAVSMAVVSGPNAGQRGTVVTDETGQALWRFETTKTSPTSGSTDVVRAWIDANRNGVADSGEAQNTNPYFTLPSSSSQGQGQELKCDGRTPTITVGADQKEIFGTGGPDVIASSANNVTIYAGDGDDIVCAYGNGARVSAGNGNDRIFVFGSDAMVSGDDGDDNITALTNNNRVQGSGGNDTITFGNFGGAAYGGEGDDTLVNGTRAALLSGGNGNGRLFSKTATGTYDGGNGDDDFNIVGKISRS